MVIGSEIGWCFLISFMLSCVGSRAANHVLANLRVARRCTVGRTFGPRYTRTNGTVREVLDIISRGRDSLID